MSLMDIDKLSPIGFVSQYIAEIKGSGHFLAREEVSIIEKWLELSRGCADDIVVVLDEILPKKLETAKAKGRKTFSIKSIDRLMSKHLKDRQLLKA